MKMIISLFLISTSVFAASTASLNIKGTVAESCSVSLVETIDASTVDILAGESGIKVATVTETCNRQAGYSIFMTSQNGGKMMSGANSVPYTMAYFNTSYKTITSVPLMMKTVSNLTGKTTATSDILITVIGQPNMLSGVYTDTITISIQGN